MLIQIEGPSGVGKTTLAEALTARPPGDMRPVIDIARREELLPEDVAWTLGRYMRDLRSPAEPLEAAFLYSARTAARARLVTRHDGAVVVADRFRISLYVAIRAAGIAADTAQLLVNIASRGVVPDHTLLLEVDYDTHCRRLDSRRQQPIDRSQFEMLRELFVEAYSVTPGHKLRFDTTDLSAQEVRTAVIDRLPALGGVPCGDMS